MTHPGRRAGLRRAVALLLLAVFLGSGTTLPSADALLHHSGDQAETQRPHIEPAGGCASHVESCVLGRAATGTGAVVADAVVLTLAAADYAAAETAGGLPPLSSFRGIFPPSRAPPASIA
jgi:hypothetical protein